MDMPSLTLSLLLSSLVIFFLFQYVKELFGRYK